MASGRLLRVSKYRGDPNAIAYIVAIPESAKAIEAVRQKVGTVGGEFEDVARVSDALLQAFNISPGEFVCADELSKRSPPRGRSQFGSDGTCLCSWSRDGTSIKMS
jgi:hypothetical protein